MTSGKTSKKRRAAEPVADAGADLSWERLADDGEDVAVRRGSDGAAYVLPRSLLALSPQAEAEVARCQGIMHALAYGQEQLEASVAELRRLGLSWDSIGRVIGLSGEAVRKRFSE